MRAWMTRFLSSNVFSRKENCDELVTVELMQQRRTYFRFLLDVEDINFFNLALLCIVSGPKCWED